MKWLPQTEGPFAGAQFHKTVDMSCHRCKFNTATGWMVLGSIRMPNRQCPLRVPCNMLTWGTYGHWAPPKPKP